jgi:hypothetical protein
LIRLVDERAQFAEAKRHRQQGSAFLVLRLRRGSLQSAVCRYRNPDEKGAAYCRTHEFSEKRKKDARSQPTFRQAG